MYLYAYAWISSVISLSRQIFLQYFKLFFEVWSTVLLQRLLRRILCHETRWAVEPFEARHDLSPANNDPPIPYGSLNNELLDLQKIPNNKNFGSASTFIYKTMNKTWQNLISMFIVLYTEIYTVNYTLQVNALSLNCFMPMGGSGSTYSILSVTPASKPNSCFPKASTGSWATPLSLKLELKLKREL